MVVNTPPSVEYAKSRFRRRFYVILQHTGESFVLVHVRRRTSDKKQFQDIVGDCIVYRSSSDKNFSR
ncbi:hypothetical protein ScPMuIL_003824 [Solemya velum]